MVIWRRQRKKLTSICGIPFVVFKKDQELGPNEMLIGQEPSNQEFNTGTLTGKKLQEVVRESRAAASPGPIWVPYIVYMRCTGILKFLWKLFWTIWRRGKIPEQWSRANGIWMPKEEASKEIEQFRNISLLNTLAWRFSHFCVSNGYIDTSIKKGGNARLPGKYTSTNPTTKKRQRTKVTWLHYGGTLLMDLFLTK